VSGVDGVDATGLGVILAVHRRAVAQGRRLVLDGVGPGLARVLAVTKLHRVLVVRRRPDMAAAPVSAQPAPPTRS
jgi:anti-anti-sigma factor